jgi:hypothetical protein
MSARTARSEVFLSHSGEFKIFIGKSFFNFSLHDIFPFSFLSQKSSSSTSSRNSSETRKSLAQLDEGELFMELIKDIANELDIDVLCHKILVNVQLLANADRGSLFLVKGNSPQSRTLHAKLFDVTQDTGELKLHKHSHEKLPNL